MALAMTPVAQGATVKGFCGGVACGAGIKPLSKAFPSNFTLLSQERRVQSQFSLLALQRRRGSKWAARTVKAELATDANKGNVINVNDAESMEKYIAETGDRMVVVDISTTTCGPCKLIFPKVVSLSEEFPEVLFLKINGDTNSGTRALMKKWKVAAVPSFRFFKKGALVHSHVGVDENKLRSNFMTHYHQPLNVEA